MTFLYRGEFAVASWQEQKGQDCLAAGLHTPFLAPGERSVYCKPPWVDARCLIERSLMKTLINTANAHGSTVVRARLAAAGCVLVTLIWW
jgi:hypothetical protein